MSEIDDLRKENAELLAALESRCRDDLSADEFQQLMSKLDKPGEAIPALVEAFRAVKKREVSQTQADAEALRCGVHDLRETNRTCSCSDIVKRMRPVQRSMRALADAPETAMSEWEIVREKEEMIRRTRVPGGWLYQVQQGRSYRTAPGTIGRERDRGEPTWWQPVFVADKDAT